MLEQLRFRNVGALSTNRIATLPETGEVVKVPSVRQTLRVVCPLTLSSVIRRS